MLILQTIRNSGPTRLIWSDFLVRQERWLLRSGREQRSDSDHSITVRGNEWYDHAAGKGGLAIDFVQMFMAEASPDAVTMLLGGEQGSYTAPGAA